MIKSYYYASFDPHNTGWQQAVIVADLGNVSYTQCYLEAIYSHNEGDVYFDHAFGALTDGAIANTYDNNYSETRYHGYTVTTLYDSLMHVVKSCTKRNSDENYFATTYNYSAANRLVSTVDPNGIETVNDANDENANILEKTTRKGNLKLRETSEYDNGDYLIRSVNTNGSETTFDYNADGSLKSATLPSEQTISYAYNNMGQLLSLTANVNGKLNTNSITYKYGYVTRLRHGSTTYDFTYDGYGRVRTVKAGGTTVLTNTYTDFGTNLDGVSGAVSRVVSKDALGNTVTAYADKYGRVIASKKNNEELTKEVYDLAGNLTNHIDNESGISYNYTYNEHNQVTEYTEKKGTTTRVKTSCTYDTYYRPMTSTYIVDGKSYSYSCSYANSLGDELSTFGTPLGTVMYTRDELKRLKSKRYTCKNASALQSYYYAPNRADSAYTSQLVRELYFTVGSNVQRLSYTYDASGNITAIEDNAGAVASYEYDGLGRLTRENIAGKKTVKYYYDNAGNLTSKKEYAYTTGNLGAIKATHSYQYASGTWGDRLEFYDGACITYNAAGYPICYRGNALTWSGGNLTKYGNLTFDYNDAGIRTKKGTTEYIVKGNLILAEKRGDTVIHYYYDDFGVAGFEYNGQKYFYRKNLQGDIIGIYDSCWNLLGQYEYDAWGNLLSQIGSEILKINPFRYRGYYCDTESGIYYLNSRYYDPVIGRFISPDRLENLDPGTINGLNLYVYSFDNPVMVKHEYVAAEMRLVPCSSLTAGNADGNGNTTDTSWFSSALGILQTIVGSQSEIRSAMQYIRAKGIFTRFAWATRMYYNLPTAANSWNIIIRSSSKFANFGTAVDAIFKKLVTGNAKANFKALIGSFGKTVGITVAINAVFNLVENGFNVTDPNVWIDTAIDTAIGVASYYLAAGLMAGIGALFFASSLPGAVMMLGVVVLSWAIEKIIRWIIGYQD